MHSTILQSFPELNFPDILALSEKSLIKCGGLSCFNSSDSVIHLLGVTIYPCLQKDKSSEQHIKKIVELII